MTNFDSLLKTQISAQPGTYNLYVESYTEVPAVLNLTEANPDSERNTSHVIDPSLPADAIIRQPYILIHTSEPLINIRIYPQRISYFMRNISRQFDYTTSALTLSELLEYLKKHKFTTQLTFDARYGEQYDFR